MSPAWADAYRRHVRDHGPVEAAYHGTSRERADAIKKHGFRPSSGDDLYLGRGVYFWLFNVETAKWWATKKFPDRPRVVLRARVEMESVFNLDEPKARRVLEDTREYLASKYSAEANLLKQIEKRAGLIELVFSRLLPDVGLVMETYSYKNNRGEEGRTLMISVRKEGLCTFLEVVATTQEGKTWLEETSMMSGGGKP
jgi:hypothetical protein